MSTGILTDLSEVDTSIDEDVLNQQKAFIVGSPKLLKELDETSEYLEQEIQFYTSLRDIGEGAKIPLDEYLERHPEILQQNAIRNVRRRNLSWTEYTRKHNEPERLFCRQARDLYGGRFGEVFQTVTVLNDNTLKKYLAFSGKADSVSYRDIKRSIDNEIDLQNICAVILVHNHPDFYRDTKVREIREGPTEGFFSNGGLSRGDITLADILYHKRFCKVPLIIRAINERGFTHSYIAGTSVPLLG